MFTVRYYLCDILFTEQDPGTDSQSGKRDEVRMEKDKKQEKWVQPRHRVIRKILGGTLGVYTRLRYHARIEPFREEGDRQYLVLMNHQTPFDQFFVSISFRQPVYYMATEDIFSLGWVSSLIRWLVAPIPIKKQAMDIGAVRTCIRVAGEGGTIGIAPEGNRTYSGKTEYMNPSIAFLAKKLKLPIALYRIEGGYGTQPRWSDCIRRGTMHCYVSEVLEPEQYLSMTNDELAARIAEGLYVNEGVADEAFRHKRKAQYLERAVYVCPYCGLSTFESDGNFVACKKCGRRIEYTEKKELRGVGFDFPYRFMTEWYDAQCDYVNALDTADYTETPLYRETASVFEVLLKKRKLPLMEDTTVALYGDRLVLGEGSDGEICLPFCEVSGLSVLGGNKGKVYHGEKVYQLKGSKRFNALKYVHIYYRYKNLTRGESDGKFLGL